MQIIAPNKDKIQVCFTNLWYKKKAFRNPEGFQYVNQMI